MERKKHLNVTIYKDKNMCMDVFTFCL